LTPPPNARVDGIIDQVHASRARDGALRLLVPGEIEADLQAAHTREGIPLARMTVDDIAAAAEALGVDAHLSSSR
jgi:LDH2 family malate/lactate/ureidoglycolate dehydrogenase